MNWSLIWTSPTLSFMAVGIMLLIAALLIYIGIRFGEWRSRRYWRRVLAEGAHLAREHPEWLAEAVAEFEIVPADTREIALRPNKQSTITIETARRVDLEAYARRLEIMVARARDGWQGALGVIAHLEREIEHQTLIKVRHWKRIQRIDHAYQGDGDIFAAIHPRLARERTP